MQKRSKLKITYIAAALIFLSALAGSIILMQKPETDVVVIMRDNSVLYRFDLSSAEDQKLVIPYKDSYNTVEIKDGKIRVAEAGCRDNTCVKTGALDGGAPIVCLPNHLVIKYIKGGGELDAAAG